MTVPKSWTRATLADVAKWGSGGTPTAQRDDYYGGNIPWALSGDLKDVPSVEPSLTITDAGLRNSSAKLVEPGTVLIAMYGATIGKLGIATHPLATNQAVAFARPLPGVIEPRFLFWYLRSQRQLLVAAGKGAAQKNISQTTLKGWPIPLPPLVQQRRIVEIIERQFSRLDAADASLKRAMINLATVRRSAAAKLLDIHEKPRPLNDLIAAGRPICYGILMPKEDVPNGVPYVRVKDFPGGAINVHSLRRTTRDIAEKYKRSALRPGDVLVSIRGTYGRVAIVPPELVGANITQDTARISPGEGILPAFLAAYLGSEPAQRFLRGAARGVAVKGVNIGDLRRLPVPVPSLQEQHRLVEVSQRHSSIHGALSVQLLLVLRRSAQLRTVIMQKAFVGGLAQSSGC